MIYAIIAGLILDGGIGFDDYDYGFLGKLIFIFGGISGAVIGEIIKRTHNKFLQPDYVIGTTKSIMKYQLYWAIGIQLTGAFGGVIISSILRESFSDMMLLLMIQSVITLIVLFVGSKTIKSLNSS